jgi:hypothetical protein
VVAGSAGAGVCCAGVVAGSAAAGVCRAGVVAGSAGVVRLAGDAFLLAPVFVARAGFAGTSPAGDALRGAAVFRVAVLRAGPASDGRALAGSFRLGASVTGSTPTWLVLASSVSARPVPVSASGWSALPGSAAVGVVAVGVESDLAAAGAAAGAAASGWTRRGAGFAGDDSDLAEVGSVAVDADRDSGAAGADLAGSSPGRSSAAPGEVVWFGSLALSDWSVRRRADPVAAFGWRGSGRSGSGGWKSTVGAAFTRRGRGAPPSARSAGSGVAGSGGGVKVAFGERRRAPSAGSRRFGSLGGCSCISMEPSPDRAVAQRWSAATPADLPEAVR